MEFEYDPKKSKANKAKHGIDFEEAKGLWLYDGRITASARTEGGEQREFVIGKIGENTWACVTTKRGKKIRIISCRPARDNEKEKLT